MTTAMDIICFSHLRWDFVFQRPQHLMSRFARNNRVFFIEEPVFDSASDFNLVQQDPATGIWVITPHLTSQFKAEEALKILLDELIKSKVITEFLSWYYSPMALKYSQHL